jgi:hypothetical protein
VFQTPCGHLLVRVEDEAVFESMVQFGLIQGVVVRGGYGVPSSRVIDTPGERAPARKVLSEAHRVFEVL